MADWRKGEWGLLTQNDPTFRWRTTPTIDPAFRMSEVESDAWLDSLTPGTIEYRRAFWYGNEADGLDFVEAFGNCDPNSGYELVAAAMARGYDRERDGIFVSWFFDYLGEFLVTAVAEFDEASDDWHRKHFGPDSIDESIGARPLPGEPFYVPNGPGPLA
ncbi:hypothetical protein [Gordonia effusa]|uniref:hypothetical protein n=1 Tax=Gordonia effusa TaxID=263908 RepID=UPI001FE095DB|nr:hypothetical protein [Gordonia effusa]